MKSSKIERILTRVTQWSCENSRIIALGLVGSYARGNPKKNSDIDLMFLTSNCLFFQESREWMYEVNWECIDLKIEDWKDINYGVVWSRHLYLTNQTEIEFSFGYPSWASINPIEIGTLQVIQNGSKILYDPQKILQNLLNEANQRNIAINC